MKHGVVPPRVLALVIPFLLGALVFVWPQATRAAIIQTVAGGLSGSRPALSINLGVVYGVATDDQGNFYTAGRDDNRIWKVDAVGIITLVAGNGAASFSGDNGAAGQAGLNSPRGVARDGAGNLYIGDTWNNRVRKVSADGTITTVAGNGVQGF